MIRVDQPDEGPVEIEESSHHAKRLTCSEFYGFIGEKGWMCLGTDKAQRGEQHRG